MGRKYAFWGTSLIAFGLGFIGIRMFSALEILSYAMDYLLGAGIFLLGVSLVVQRGFAQAIAAALAGLCIGLYLAGQIEYRVQRGWLKVDWTNSDDDASQEADTLPWDNDSTATHPRPDTLAKPIAPVY
ncbi:MAG: hypothetical protein N2971_01815 [Chlorobi bacterium]|nr:hypothetical protein [Chlorobiota bacterium]